MLNNQENMDRTELTDLEYIGERLSEMMGKIAQAYDMMHKESWYNSDTAENLEALYEINTWFRIAYDFYDRAKYRQANECLRSIYWPDSILGNCSELDKYRSIREIAQDLDKKIPSNVPDRVLDEQDNNDCWEHVVAASILPVLADDISLLIKFATEDIDEYVEVLHSDDAEEGSKPSKCNCDQTFSETLETPECLCMCHEYNVDPHDYLT